MAASVTLIACGSATTPGTIGAETSSSAVAPVVVESPVATTTSLPPWPNATTTTIVVDTIPPSTTEQPQPSPLSETWAPVAVLTGEYHPAQISVDVGDTIALIDDLGSGPSPIDPSSPQNSFGVDPDLLRVVAYGTDCPPGSLCVAWVAVDAGTSPIETAGLQHDLCPLDDGPTAATIGCPEPTTSVSIGIGRHTVARIGADADGTTIAVPVGAVIDIHLDEVSSRAYPAGVPLTPEYWNAPTFTNPAVLTAIGKQAPTLCANAALGRHDCLSLLAAAPGMTTLSFESGYTCDLGDCSPNPTYATRTFTLTVAVTPS